MRWHGMEHTESLLPKIFPDFMKKYNSNHQSNKALGIIYRKCENVRHHIDMDWRSNHHVKQLLFEEDHKFDALLEVDGYKKYIDDAQDNLTSYCDEMLSIQYRWDVKTDTDIECFIVCPLRTVKLANVKEFEIKQKIKVQVNSLKQKYRQIFFREFDDRKDDEDA